MMGIGSVSLSLSIIADPADRSRTLDNRHRASVRADPLCRLRIVWRRYVGADSGQAPRLPRAFVVYVTSVSGCLPGERCSRSRRRIVGCLAFPWSAVC